MIGSLIAVVFWVLLVAVIRHETRSQRAEWEQLEAFDAFRREMTRPR